MVEHSQRRPRALASPDSGLAAQPGSLSPPSPSSTSPSSSSTSPSSSSRAASTKPDRKLADTLPNRHDSHSPGRSTVHVTPQESLEINVRAGRLKRRKPLSRQSSPEPVRSTSPGHSATATASRTEKKVRKASTQQASPSPSPPPARRKGKSPAADHSHSPSVGVSLDAVSGRSASPVRIDHEPRPDDVSRGPETTCASVVPAAKQREIDAVVSRLPPSGPRIEVDANSGLEVDDQVHVDEGFYDEALESHYQAFMETTEKLRMKRRPYYSVRAPGLQKTSNLVQKNGVQKTIRMRRREPKNPGMREQVALPTNSAVASTPSAT